MANRDDHVVARVLDGDREAFGELVQRYQAAIYNLMTRSTGDVDRAADLTQDTFLKAYARLTSFQPGGSFFSWLYTIGLNVVRDDLRRRSRRNSLFGLHKDWLFTEEGHRDPGEAEEHRARKLTVKAGLARLPAGYRELLILRYKMDLEIRELADIFKLSRSAVKMRLHRGLSMLKDRCVGEQDESEE